MQEEYEVIVAGAGPVGVAAANLLGSQGIRTLLLERDESPYTFPRVASVDEEALRIFQSLGLLELLVPEMRSLEPALELVGEGGRVLVTMHRHAQPYGFPVAVTILQQRVEQVLREALRRFACVDFRQGHELVRLEQQAEGLQAEVQAAGRRQVVRAQYVLGCDGAHSTVRRQCGVELVGNTAPEAWLVLDTRVERPHVSTIRMFSTDALAVACVPLPGGLHRWEVRLRPEEDVARMESLPREALEALLAEVTGAEGLGEIIRQRVYRHHARTAERFQVGRAFLLGDAAHLMPPFAGQGLCTGLRDAANLCWKLAAVLRGRMGAQVLSTYETERRRHTLDTVSSSQRLGALLFPRSRAVRWGRNSLLAALGPLRRPLEEGRMVKPLPMAGKGLVVGPAPAGALFLQPRVSPTGRPPVLLDEVLGPGFAWVARSHSPRALLAAAGLAPWEVLQARAVQVLPRGARAPATTSNEQLVEDTEGALEAWFSRHRVDLALIRPDRYVAAACRAHQALPLVEQVLRLVRPASLPTA